MSEFFIHPGDVAIIRDAERFPDQARVYDADGNHRHTFPASWTDEQIQGAVHFANKAFEIGVRIGMERKAHEIQSVLGVPAIALEQ